MLLFQLLSIIHFYTYYGFKLPFVCYYINYADYCNYSHYGTYVNFTYISIRHCLDDKILQYVILWTLICLLYILYYHTYYIRYIIIHINYYTFYTNYAKYEKRERLISSMVATFLYCILGLAVSTVLMWLADLGSRSDGGSNHSNWWFNLKIFDNIFGPRYY